MLILFVEDDVRIRKAFKREIGNDHEIFEAENGQEALDILRTMKFDLVITDNSMPVMNGLDLCLNIHELGIGVKVIMISGEDRPDLLSNQVIFFKKPITATEILERVNSH